MALERPRYAQEEEEEEEEEDLCLRCTCPRMGSCQDDVEGAVVAGDQTMMQGELRSGREGRLRRDWEAGLAARTHLGRARALLRPCYDQTRSSLAHHLGSEHIPHPAH
jgi:hypothetical protein